MTIIVYRNGVMASDTSIFGDRTMCGNVRKINMREDGALIGGAGIMSFAAEFMRWFMNGENGERPKLGLSDKESASILIVRPSGMIEEHDIYGWYTHDTPYYAIGSGMDFAYGAMDYGASAVEAVKVAIKRNAYCGGEVYALNQRRTHTSRLDAPPLVPLTDLPSDGIVIKSSDYFLPMTA